MKGDYIMNKKEFKKVSKELINRKFQYFSEVKVVEVDCYKSDIDKMWCIRYIVIINSISYREVFISEDAYYGLYYKETMLDRKCEKENNFYNTVTFEIN